MKKEAVNPFLPEDVYIADGEPHVFGDRVYLFGSHDKENGDTFCMLDYEFWSAPLNDLSDWSSKGVNYSARQDPLYSETMRYMYAPDCVRGNDGRYYLYYCMAGFKGHGAYSNPISIAVCDTPDGKYEYLGKVNDQDGRPLLRYACFDPALINDNGTVHLYYGTTLPWLDKIPFKGLRQKREAEQLGRSLEEVKAVRGGLTGSYHVILKDDMMTAASDPVRIDDSIEGEDYEAHRFFEGSSIRKIGDRYYFIYSTVNNHELCYAVSDRPDGGFAFGGVLISNGDIGYKGRKPKDRLNHTGNNHGSIEHINGKWYVFYHKPVYNSDYSRKPCAEEITIADDGSIAQAEMTSCGLNGGPLKGGIYPASICCNVTNGRMKHSTNQKKETSEPCVMNRDGEMFVGKVRNGTVIGYKYFSLSGRVRISLKARGSGGDFLIRLGDIRTVVSAVASERWTEAEAEVDIPYGTYPLYFMYMGRGTVEISEIGVHQK